MSNTILNFFLVILIFISSTISFADSPSKIEALQYLSANEIKIAKEILFEGPHDDSEINKDFLIFKELLLKNFLEKILSKKLYK